MDRRRFLNRLVSLITLVTAGSRMSIADEPADIISPEHLQASISRFAYRLFPHDNLAAAVYEDVAQALILRSSEDSALKELLTAGVRQLDDDDVAWLERDMGDQVDAMVRMEGGEFFQVMRRTTIEHIYRDSRVWQRIGYEGSSVEKSGYLERGFDDIDWLPPADEGQ